MERLPEIVNQEVTTTRGRLNLRVTFDDGSRISRALGLPAGATDHAIELAKLNAIRRMQDGAAVAGCGYKTVADLLSAYSKWYAENKRSRKVHNMTVRAAERFGQKSPYHITPGMVREWVEDMAAHGFSYDTARLRVAALQGAYSWLRKRGRWTGQNPCDGVITDYRGRFRAPVPSRCTVEDYEYQLLMSHENAAVRLFVGVSRYTGLRPSEIVRLDPRKINRTALTWAVRVTKTSGREFDRLIAVPSALVAFVGRELETAPWAFPDIEHALSRVASGLGSPGITCKTFRKDFAHRMERAGAGPEIINLHQGRGQHGVLYEHYLRDPHRAVRLAGPFVSRMFGDRLSIVRSDAV